MLMAICQKRSISYGIINFALGVLNQNHFCIFFFFFIFIFLQYWKKTDSIIKKISEEIHLLNNFFNENYTSDKHSENLLVLVLHLLTLSTMKFSFHCSLLLKNAKSSTGSTAQIFFAPLWKHFQMPWIPPEWVSIHHFQWPLNLSEL